MSKIRNNYKFPYRRKVSAPLKYLLKENLINSRKKLLLDFGCGLGFDINNLKKDYNIDMQGYDLYTSVYPDNLYFHTVLCTYVLNTMAPIHWTNLLRQVQNFMLPIGHSFITVPRYFEKPGLTDKKGRFTQYYVELDLKILHEAKGRYIIYVMGKETPLKICL